MGNGYVICNCKNFEKNTESKLFKNENVFDTQRENNNNKNNINNNKKKI
jgi:hypothetical protein